MIELRLNIDIAAFKESNYVYIWFKSKPTLEPFYVGETSKSISDRSGLHIRRTGSTSRSGSVVGTHIYNMKWPAQEYVVRGYEIPMSVLEAVAEENGATKDKKSQNKARKAIEYRLYVSLKEKYPELYKIRASRWEAKSSEKFIGIILEETKNA